MFGSDSQEHEVDLEQQASFQDPNAYLNASRLKELQNLALWELNPQDILDQLEHQYRGEIYDSSEQKWVKKFKGLNDEAAAELTSFMSAYVNKINFLNDFEQDDINRRAWEARQATIEWLKNHYRIYKIDKRILTFIVRKTDSLIYGAYNKSHRGGERKFLGSVHNTQENTLKNPNARKGITSIFR